MQDLEKHSAFQLRAVHKRYDDYALSDINLALPRGEVMGLVGVNGAGKSTLLRILMGLIRVDDGSVEVLGRAMPEHQAIVKRDVGFAADDIRLYPGQTLRWHLDFIAKLFPTWDETYAERLLTRFDLREHQKLAGFSHGQRVKALLLLTVARKPALLLLDEPTTGLDPVARMEVLDALADVLRDESRSVLFSSHNTADVEQLADSIAFLHRGALIASDYKDAFLDRWRRILCRGDDAGALDRLPGMASIRRSAPTIEIKASAFDEDLLARIASLGLVIHSVERMSLEDIFVTSVSRGALS
jgi:ABC-2 type transport system ATP-binding protein